MKINQKRFLDGIFYELTEFSFSATYIRDSKYTKTKLCVSVCTVSFEPAGNDNAYIEGTLMRPEQIKSHEISSP